MEFSENFRLKICGPAMVNVESQPVLEEEFKELARLRKYMAQCMWRAGGCGLAAPQVGVFKNFLIVESSPHQILDLINPYITKMYGRELDDVESCLSLPPQGNHCRVPRMEIIQVEASSCSEPWIRSTYTFEGGIARRVQHEIDHLEGTFFVDRVSLNRKREVMERFEYWKSVQKSFAKLSQKREEFHVDAGLVALSGGRPRLS